MMRLGDFLYRVFLRTALYCYHGWLWLSTPLPTRRPKEEKLTVLATATFYSEQWLSAHLDPVAGAENCGKVIMVATAPVPVIEKVEARYPPRWLQACCGGVAARLLLFAYLAVRLRPDVLLGFHLLLNGLWALALARLTGARAVYLCGGGPREVRGGGIETENRIFRRLARPDPVIERLLLAAVAKMHGVVTMGEGAKRFFREHGVVVPVHVIAGGFDASRFCPRFEEKKYDFVLVGRLSEIKRVDRFLAAVAKTRERFPAVTAAIVGDGPDRQALEAQSRALGLESCVCFAGWQQNVADWLQRSRCMVLTSDSEGLSQALIQGMMCGLPGLVSDVGDLSEVVQDESNGILVSPLTVEQFAVAMQRLLGDPELSERLARAALKTGGEFSIEAAASKWQEFLQELVQSEAKQPEEAR